MGQNLQGRAGFAGAQQDKASLAIFGKVFFRVRLIDVARAVDEPSGTRQAVTLMTERGQNDPRGEGCIPDVLVTIHFDGARVLAVEQFDSECLSVSHRPGLTSSQN